jgi:hypothetical protein
MLRLEYASPECDEEDDAGDGASPEAEAELNRLVHSVVESFHDLQQKGFEGEPEMQALIARRGPIRLKLLG